MTRPFEHRKRSPEEWNEITKLEDEAGGVFAAGALVEPRMSDSRGYSAGQKSVEPAPPAPGVDAVMRLAEAFASRMAQAWRDGGGGDQAPSIASQKEALRAAVTALAAPQAVRVSNAPSSDYSGVTLRPFRAAHDNSMWLHIRHPAGDTNVPIRLERDAKLWTMLEAMAAPQAVQEPVWDGRFDRAHANWPFPGAPPAPTAQELPPLPEPAIKHQGPVSGFSDYYTADQMREYARAAIAQARP